MAKRKLKINKLFNKVDWSVVSMGIFVVSSFVILTNNSISFFQNFDIPYDLNTIAWIGLILSIIWSYLLFTNKIERRRKK